MSTLLSLQILASRIAKSRFLTAGTHGLHTARFAYLHELARLHISPDRPTTHLPIGRGKAGSVLGLAPQPNRPELGNVAIFAPTRGGKGLDAIVKIFTWKHSMIVNDIKGELYDKTAGFLGQKSAMCMCLIRPDTAITTTPIKAGWRILIFKSYRASSCMAI